MQHNFPCTIQRYGPAYDVRVSPPHKAKIPLAVKVKRGFSPLQESEEISVSLFTTL